MLYLSSIFQGAVSMKAVLLAAGASRRLLPHTRDLPKCLIRIGDKTILEHQLDAIDYTGIQEAVIVVGYCKEKIIEFIGPSYKNICTIKYIENEEYASTNTIYSLYLAREEFSQDDFIYFNADVLFHKDIVKLLVEHDSTNVLAVDYKKCGEEEVKFTTNTNNRIVRLSKEISSNEAEGEFIGVAKFGTNITRNFVDALEHHSLNGEKNLFFEKAVEDILHTDLFTPLDVSHIPNIEIDFPEDLERAQKEIYPAIMHYGKPNNKK
jgi:choline kinase